MTKFQILRDWGCSVSLAAFELLAIADKDGSRFMAEWLEEILDGTKNGD